MGPYYERSSGHRALHNRTLTSEDALRKRVQYQADAAEMGTEVAWAKAMQGEHLSAGEGRLAAAASTGAKVRDVGTIAGPLPRQELTGKETGMEGPFVREDVTNKHPEIVQGDEGPVHDDTTDEARRDRQFPTDFAVITWGSYALDGGRLIFASDEAEADRIAAVTGGLAYRIHGDKAFTLTMASM